MFLRQNLDATPGGFGGAVTIGQGRAGPSHDSRPRASAAGSAANKHLRHGGLMIPNRSGLGSVGEKRKSGYCRDKPSWAGRCVPRQIDRRSCAGHTVGRQSECVCSLPSQRNVRPPRPGSALCHTILAQPQIASTHTHV